MILTMQTKAKPPSAPSLPMPGRTGNGARKPIKRSYKPLPTTRYLVAGLTAIIVSMGLIAGAMSSTNTFDTRPWDSSQEMHWDPFEHHMIAGLDVGSLSEAGRRTSEAIKPKKGATPTEKDATSTETKTQTEPEKTPEAGASESPAQPENPSSTVVQTFAVPGAPQEPTASEAPAGPPPPVAMGPTSKDSPVDRVHEVAVPKA
ncbi:hypothetical protein [Mobiluncus curtisii]|uniref:hypothetical protein n=2 Tax=Mobiluncus curtisii TaxID=2051 RepID=UPI0020168922|nr:hypothetical protein [Mobiluncus curtisii]